ncbi:MAG: MBL fold metallo-hydrolase [Actinobacteria bacterium]|nr:MBL fold metallo-hydrolase [Actinomycetota bacterium]
MTTVSFTHIGGPTTLLEIGGWRILTDPTFDAPGRRYRFGWGTSSRKTSGPAITADEVGPLDAVLLTHEHHADNLDDTGRRLLPTAGVVVTTVSGAGRLGLNARGLRNWEAMQLAAPGKPTITVTGTPCRHGPPGSHPIVGDVIGFALGWDGQEHGALWISGDTVLYDGVREVADRVDVGTAIVHLGRVRFPITGPVKYTMDITDAVELCQLIQPRTIVPVHYEGWSHFTQGRGPIEAQLVRAPRAVSSAVQWVSIGEPVELTV